jgi:hypothetical protein
MTLQPQPFLPYKQEVTGSIPVPPMAQPCGCPPQCQLDASVVTSFPSPAQRDGNVLVKPNRRVSNAGSNPSGTPLVTSRLGVGAPFSSSTLRRRQPPSDASMRAVDERALQLSGAQRRLVAGGHVLDQFDLGVRGARGCRGRAGLRRSWRDWTQLVRGWLSEASPKGATARRCRGATRLARL